MVVRHLPYAKLGKIILLVRVTSVTRTYCSETGLIVKISMNAKSVHIPALMIASARLRLTFHILSAKIVIEHAGRICM